MAGVIADSDANALLNLLLGSTGSSHELGLIKVAPASDGTGATEVSGGSYARVSFTDNSTTWPAAASRQKKNGIAFTFPSPTADWTGVGETVVGCAVFVSSVLKRYFAFTSGVVILNGYPAPVVTANSLTARIP